MNNPNDVFMSNLLLSLINSESEEDESMNEVDDVFEFIENVMIEIHNTINTEKRENSMSRATFKSLNNILILHDRFTHDERLLLGNKLAECNSGSMLIQFINILSKRGNCYPLEGYNHRCFQIVMSICWNYSDVSSAFSVQLCENGIVSMLLSMLKKFQFQLSEHQRDLAILSAITLAQIVEEKDNDVILANSAIIRTIVELLGQSLDDPDHRTEGFSATELASGLTRLANNAENSEIIVENGILNHIRRMLLLGNESEEIVAAEALWTFSFSDKNKNEILADEEISNVLQVYSKAEIPELQLAAAYTLWELNQQDGNSTQPGQKQQQEAKSTDTVSMENEDARIDITPSGEPCKHIMISYQWDCQDRMIKLKDMLKAEGYRVWLDVEEMRGSTLEAMAKAVENAAVVLMSMSKKYKESKNCRSEAVYANKCGVPVIPLKVEDNYVPDGWLGLIAGDKLYFKFASSSNFNKVFGELTKEIGNRGKNTHSSNVTVVDAPPPLSRETGKCCCF